MISRMLLASSQRAALRPAVRPTTKHILARNNLRVGVRPSKSLLRVASENGSAIAAPPKKKSLYNTESLDSTDDKEAAGSNKEDCDVFIDRDGDFVKVMCCDYGFRAGAGRMYRGNDGRIPMNMFQLAWSNFQYEYEALRRSFRFDEYKKISDRNPADSAVGQMGYSLGSGIVKGMSYMDKALEDSGVLKVLQPKEVPVEVRDENTGEMAEGCRETRQKLKQLKLSNQAVWDREHAREASGGKVDTPWFVRAVYISLCVFLDVMYMNRPIQRFWFLETVARMPYFSYITMLHLYESLGWWRAGAELRKVHFAEEWNELHHLQIMESLGGDQLWVDRFMAQHAAVVYYIVLLVLFAFSPNLAYNFSELIEAHAVDTYGEFVDANESLLKSLPPPLVAASYYRSADLYMFDEFQTSKKAEPRRPQCKSLYDVFSNIRDDEGEHVKTMAACQDESVMQELVDRREQGRRT